MNIAYLVLIFTVILVLLAVSLALFTNIHINKSIKNKLEKEKMKNDFNEKLIQQTILAQDEEKSRIGKELHDNINGLMMLAKLNIQKLNVPNSKDAISTIDEAMSLTRDLSHNLAFSSLESFGLEHTLKQFIARTQRSVDYKINFIYKAKKELSENIAQQLIRITQEAVLNINKYAKASEVEIVLEGNDENNFKLEIKDNGVGFDKDKSIEGIGLHNMKIRSESINSNLELNSEPNKGTSITISSK